MSKQKKVASVLIALLAWTVIGALLGAAGGYIVYVRQPAVFQSEGAIRIAVSKRTSAKGETVGDQRINGRNVVTSNSVLSKAASQGRLARLPGIRGKKPNEVASNLRDSGNLQVIEDDDDAMGMVFLVRFQGATPSVTQEVTQSILEATVETLKQVDNSANWDQSISLLTTTRTTIENKISDLTKERDAITDPAMVVVDGEPISSTSVRYRELKLEADQLQRLRDALTQKLRRVQSMIENGAPMNTILSNLDIPIMPVVRTETPEPKVADDKSGQSAIEKQRLAKRVQQEEAIQSELQPLIEERDKLLEKVARRHPSVVSKQKRIDELQAELAELSPLLSGLPKPTPPSPSPTRPPANDASADSSEDAKALGAQVTASLRALQSEKRQVDEDWKKALSELETAAQEFAAEKKLAADRKRIEDQMATQTQLLRQLAKRLDQLWSRSPFPTIRAEILRDPASGEQIAPELQPLVIRGVQIGLIAGLVLVSLLYLTSLASSE